MRPLIFTGEPDPELMRVRTHAERKRIDLATLLRIQSGAVPGPDNDPERCAVIHFGYHVRYTIEQQPHAWMRHLVVSLVDPRGKGNSVEVPNPTAVLLIAHELGFDMEYRDSFAGLDVRPDPKCGFAAPHIFQVIATG